MKPDWKGFCEYVISVNGNIKVSEAKKFGLPEGTVIELMIRAANDTKSFVENARRAREMERI